MLAQFTADMLLKRLDKLDSGSLDLELPNGRTENFIGKKPGLRAKLRLHDWKVVSNLALRGDTGFARDYQDGNWDTDNLQDLLAFGLMNEAATGKFISGSPVFNTISRLSYAMRRNSTAGSRRNIHSHYDLGNDFYKLWLDESMTYSAAIFNQPDENLLNAQNNKYDRILDHLGSASGRVLEIGCGWGGFAARSLQTHDFAIKGITISDAQLAYATERLAGQAEIVSEDYRAQTGLYDHIVSIEMFEAVGEAYWQTYFNKLRSLLKTTGKAMIQTITIADDKFEAYRTGSDVIRSMIFPGGMLPSQSRFQQEAGKAGFKTTDIFDFGQDYARTLEIWLANFDRRRADVSALGYDDKFIRMWRFYLAACIAGFKTGRVSVIQAELQHA